MAKRTTDGFRLGLDEDVDEKQALIDEELERQKQIDRLGRRVTLVAVLLPFLTLAILAVVYIQVNEKVAIFQDTGVGEIKTMRADTEARLTALADRQTKIETNMAEVSAEMDKKAAGFLQEIKKSEAALKAAMGDVKGDKQGADAALTQVQKQTEALAAEIKALAAGLKAFEEKAKAIDTIGGQIGKLQADMGKLAAERFDPKTLATALEQERRTYREMLTQVTRNWERQIEGLQLKVAMIERLASAPPRTAPAPSTPAPSVNKPAGGGSTGSFNEQDVR